MSNASITSVMHLGRWRLVAFVGLFLVLSAAVPYVLYQETGSELPTFDERWLSWRLVTACIALLLFYFSCDGLRLFYTLKSLGHRVAIRDLGPLVFINTLVSNITPMATGGGLVQIWYLQRHGVPIGAATAATTLRTLQAVAFIFIPTPFLLIFMDPLQDSPLGPRVGAYLAIFSVVYAGFFALILFRMRWIIALAVATLRRLARYHLISQTRLRRWRFHLCREMVRFSRALKLFFQGAPDDALLAALFTALFLLTMFSFPALLLWGLGYSIDYWTVVGLLLVTTFIMYFSPTPGAAGVAEGAFGLLFLGLVEAKDLILTIVAWRFLTIYLGMLIGVPVLLRTVVKKEPADA